MKRSKRGGSNSRSTRQARWFGSLRILPDGRMRFSPWSYVDLEHVSLRLVSDGDITVFWSGRAVMYLFPERNRIMSACFLFNLTPDQLQEAVADLRDARHGLDSWVVPALEFNSAVRTVREDHPETFKVIPELLASCRGLPVAPRWQRVRAQYFANCGVDPPVNPAEEDTQAKRPRGYVNKPTTPRKATPARKPSKTGKTPSRTPRPRKRAR